MTGVQTCALPILQNCLLKSSGENDEHFIDCLWDKDPLYFTDREAYLFDYRLHDDSPAFGAGNPSLTLPATASDAFGTPRDLTAFQSAAMRK